jgi:hypothetical protein
MQVTVGAVPGGQDRQGLRQGMSIRFASAALIAMIYASSALAAQDVTRDDEPATSRIKLGFGDFLNNDFLGDGRDRWQSASYVASWVRGYEWTGELPDNPGDILEYRVQARIIAPADVDTPAADDRLYATSYSLGAYTYFNYGIHEVSLGADLVVTGEQTGLPAFQTALHQEIGNNVPSASTVADMIPDGLYPGFVVELGRPMSLGETTEIRPFAELRAGDETLIRSGVDLYLGGIINNNLLSRDQVTGQRYTTVKGAADPGLGFVLGGDIAQMGTSIYFPDDRGPDMTESRARLRAGVLWQDDRNSVFTGMTWLSEEFETQPEAQIVGSIRLKFEF